MRHRMAIAGDANIFKVECLRILRIIRHKFHDLELARAAQNGTALPKRIIDVIHKFHNFFIFLQKNMRDDASLDGEIGALN